MGHFIWTLLQYVNVVFAFFVFIVLFAAIWHWSGIVYDNLFGRNKNVK